MKDDFEDEMRHGAYVPLPKYWAGQDKFKGVRESTFLILPSEKQYDLHLKLCGAGYRATYLSYAEQIKRGIPLLKERGIGNIIFIGFEKENVYETAKNLSPESRFVDLTNYAEKDVDKLCNNILESLI
ncbi:hypothetical protein HZA33_01245 [Candidatus Pacearchaeota archaeon]|nr:hypothetical protein [Candidatus Pacearchaeota archaeon]